VALEAVGEERRAEVRPEGIHGLSIDAPVSGRSVGTAALPAVTSGIDA
jgi:hypothetical protein